MLQIRSLFFALVSIASSAQRTQTLEHAAAAIQLGDLTSAENMLQPLLKQSPEDALALNLLGLVRLQQHKSEEAAMLFQKAIDTGHKIAGPHINLAVIYATDQPLQAIAQLGEALAISPDNRQAAELLRKIPRESAKTAIQAGQKERASEILIKARAVLPHDPELLYDSGFVAFECESYQDADRDLTEALKLQPNYPEAMYALARTYLAESLAQPAEAEMRKYLSTRPDDPTAQYGLGYILMAEQRLDEAKAAFEKSIALRPDQTESVFQLGEIALEQGQNDLARQQFNAVLARDPHHGGALAEKGVLAYRASKYDEAKTDLETAIASAPQYQKAHYYYALTLSRLGHKTEAEREFTLARTLQKQHGGEHRLLADQP